MRIASGHCAARVRYTVASSPKPSITEGYHNIRMTATCLNQLHLIGKFLSRAMGHTMCPVVVLDGSFRK